VALDVVPGEVAARVVVDGRVEEGDAALAGLALVRLPLAYICGDSKKCGGFHGLVFKKYQPELCKMSSQQRNQFLGESKFKDKSL
jgi:hypothetical protein